MEEQKQKTQEKVEGNTQIENASVKSEQIKSEKSEKSEKTEKTEKAEKKTESKPKVVKSEAVARGVSIHASKRHCMYIGNFIKGKTVDAAISDLEQVVKLKRAIPFKGEIPHRKGAMMSGRYPVEASKLFIGMLKGLKGNISVNNMPAETRIFSVVSNWASRPRRSNGKAKRTNVVIIAKPITKEATK